MSGPWAETAQLYVRTSTDVALWPLLLRAEGGEPCVECGESGCGELLLAKGAFVLAELTARVDEHIADCSAIHPADQPNG